MKILMTIMTLTILTACAVSKTKLSEEGEKVKVLTQPKSPGCNVIDKVIGMNEKGIDELAQNHARNLAARMDANAIYFEMVSNGNMVEAHGTVFQCKKDD